MLVDLECLSRNFSLDLHAGLAADAPDRVTDSHRAASAPRSPPHEADKVALEEQLEGTRITRKGDRSSLDPHLKWWLQEDIVLQGRPLHPLNMLFNPYRCIKEGWGAYLGEHTARGTWSLPEASYTLTI